MKKGTFGSALLARRARLWRGAGNRWRYLPRPAAVVPAARRAWGRRVLGAGRRRLYARLYLHARSGFALCSQRQARAPLAGAQPGAQPAW